MCSTKTMSQIPPRIIEEMGQQRRNVKTSLVPGQTLLRLDSTGEVSSEKRHCGPKSYFSNYPYNRTNKTFVGKTNCSDSPIKKFVDNIGVGSWFDSASACFGSAANYFESLSAKQTVTNRLTTESAKKSNRQYPLSTSTSDCSKQEMPSINHFDHHNMKKSSLDIGSAWSCANLLGAIFTNNTAMKMPKVDRYIPPQKRLGQQCRNCNNTAASIDPKLTPYNAKLLEKSKRNHCSLPCTRRQASLSPHRDCDSMTKTHENGNKESVSPDNKTCKQETPAGNDSDTNYNIATVENKDGVIASSIEREGGDSKSGKPDLKSNKSNNDETETTSIPDWFECDISDNSITSVPIEIDESKLEFAAKCQTSKQESSISQESSCDEKQLHNWYSVEFDSDVRKCNPQMSTSRSSENSSQKDNSESNTALNSESHTLKNEHVSKQEREIKSLQSTNGLKAKIILTSNNETRDEKSQQPELSAVLFIRNIGKRSRPSKKKRSRQKPEDQEEGSRTLKSGNAVHPCSSSGQIILSSGQSQSPIQSFQFICDSESLSLSDSDWSDSEGDDDDFDDEEFSSLENDEFLGLRCDNILGGCSIVQATCSIQPSPPSAIDRINKEWKVHISIEPKEKQTAQKSNGKKVHFAEDSSLAEVHPIIAWSHAYAAARKGPWEQYARDRERFRHRIGRTENELKLILSAEHRDKIFAERFADKE